MRDDPMPPLSKDPAYETFWSLSSFVAERTGVESVTPCYYQQTSKGSSALYQVWDPVCPATAPEPAIERAKALAEQTGRPFRLDPKPFVPYPS
jgi:hypothetical protein